MLEGVRPQDFYVPGSLLKVVLDADNPIAYGMPREAAVFFIQNAAFSVEGGATSVATYTLTNPLMSGWILGEEKLNGKTAVADVPVGRGRVILLAIRPQFRPGARKPPSCCSTRSTTVPPQGRSTMDWARAAIEGAAFLVWPIFVWRRAPHAT